MNLLRLARLCAADAIIGDTHALAAAFDHLGAEASDAIGNAAGRLLEQHAHLTGDWMPWAAMWAEAGRAQLREAGAGMRARMDEDANRRRDWDLRMARRSRERAESELPRAVLPLIRRGADQAVIEEVAGRYAEPQGPLRWPEVFRLLNAAFDHVHGAPR